MPPARKVEWAILMVKRDWGREGWRGWGRGDIPAVQTIAGWPIPLPALVTTINTLLTCWGWGIGGGVTNSPSPYWVAPGRDTRSLIKLTVLMCASARERCNDVFSEFSWPYMSEVIKYKHRIWSVFCRFGDSLVSPSLTHALLVSSNFNMYSTSARCTSFVVLSTHLFLAYLLFHTCTCCF